MCEGHGKIAAVPQVVAIVVPPGVANGTTLRLIGAGSRRVDGSAGDIEFRALVGGTAAANSDLLNQFVSDVGLQRPSTTCRKPRCAANVR
jgi:DnaJ-class molecular chaperone